MWKAVQFETIEKLNDFLTNFKREDKLEMTFNSNGLYGLFYWENVVETDDPEIGNSELPSDSESNTESKSESESTSESESVSATESTSESELNSTSETESESMTGSESNQEKEAK